MAYSKRYERSRQPMEKGKSAEVDLSFLNQRFYDASGNLREDLLDAHARAWGERLAPVGERVERGSDQVTTAQIRRFYGDLKALESEMKRSGLDMQSPDERDLAPFRARIKMLKSKVSYAAGRGNVSKAFHQLVERCVDTVQCPRDFTAFALFFESLLGYYYYFEDVKKSMKKGGETGDE